MSDRKKINLKNIEATFSREIEYKPAANLKFFLGITFILVGIFLFLGILPQIENLGTAMHTKRELTLLKEGLEAKLDQINKYGAILEVNKSLIQKLNQSIPDEDLMEVYLEEVVGATSSTGFVITEFRRIYATEALGEEIEIEIELLGSIVNLPKTLKKLEEINRVTQIERIVVETTEHGDNIKLNVKIYSLGEIK